ncbi:MAG TPA: hypothetical protein EYP04_06135 [Anaerolineae bacterium]|nr:hypothetical protein [Anaerolineae bacterium]HIQ05089.1 hypothetical protein [Anaerolineae bacterium]
MNEKRNQQITWNRLMAVFLLLVGMLAVKAPVVLASSGSTALNMENVPPPLVRNPLPGMDLKTYTDPDHGFSLVYPANWEVKETGDSVVFAGEGRFGQPVGALVFVDMDIDASYEVAPLQVRLHEAMGKVRSDFQPLSKETVVLNGIEWARTTMDCARGETTFTFVAYMAVCESTGYLFVGGSRHLVFDQQQPIFEAMMRSWRFVVLFMAHNCFASSLRTIQCFSLHPHLGVLTPHSLRVILHEKSGIPRCQVPLTLSRDLGILGKHEELSAPYPECSPRTHEREAGRLRGAISRPVQSNDYEMAMRW